MIHREIGLGCDMQWLRRVRVRVRPSVANKNSVPAVMGELTGASMLTRAAQPAAHSCIVL